MALFVLIEASQPQSRVGSVSNLSGEYGNKGNHELKIGMFGERIMMLREVNLIE